MNINAGYYCILLRPLILSVLFTCPWLIVLWFRMTFPQRAFECGSTWSNTLFLAQFFLFLLFLYLMAGPISWTQVWPRQPSFPAITNSNFLYRFYFFDTHVNLNSSQAHLLSIYSLVRTKALQYKQGGGDEFSVCSPYPYFPQWKKFQDWIIGTLLFFLNQECRLLIFCPISKRNKQRISAILVPRSILLSYQGYMQSRLVCLHKAEDNQYVKITKLLRRPKTYNQNSPPRKMALSLSKVD